MLNLGERLSKAGLTVEFHAPDTSNLSREFDSAMQTSQPSTGRRRLYYKLINLGPIAALIILLRALRRGPSRESPSRHVIVFTGTWIALVAAVLRMLWPDILVHFDISGIPHREMRLARYRFWRAKLPIAEAIFRESIKKSEIQTTSNRTYASLVETQYGKRPIVFPDLMPGDDLLEAYLAVPPITHRPRVVLLYVGSLCRSRLDLFLETVVDILKDRPTLEVRVVGDGEDLTRYRGKYSSAGVVFTGYENHDGVALHLRDADICYSDVWSEIGTPYKVLEYMAAGRAVVTHDTPSTREIIANRVNGLLCANDKGSLRDAIVTLIDNPYERIRLGQAARLKILEMRQDNPTRAVLDGYEACFRRREGTTVS